MIYNPTNVKLILFIAYVLYVYDNVTLCRYFTVVFQQVFVMTLL